MSLGTDEAKVLFSSGVFAVEACATLVLANLRNAGLIGIGTGTTGNGDFIPYAGNPTRGWTSVSHNYNSYVQELTNDGIKSSTWGFSYNGATKNAIVHGHLYDVSSLPNVDWSQAQYNGQGYLMVGNPQTTQWNIYNQWNIYCIRVYENPLTAEEVEWNHKVDKERFGI